MKNIKHKITSNNKDAHLYNRVRRTKTLIKEGLRKEELEKFFTDEKLRIVCCLYYGSYTVENGTKKIKTNKEFKQVPNILKGRRAVDFTLNKYKYKKDHIEVVLSSSSYCWIKTDTDNIDNLKSILKPIGRIFVTKLEKPQNNVEKKTNKIEKPKVKKNMKPYYAALKKGYICDRIKKHNKTLADKIEKWIDNKKSKDKKAINNKVDKKIYRTVKKEISKIKTEDKSIKRNKKPIQTKLNLAA